MTGLWYDTKVKAVGAGLATAGKVAGQVEVTLATVGARGLALLLVTDSVQAALVALHVDYGHTQSWQLAAGVTFDDYIGAGMIELVCGKGGPRPREQALVRVFAARHILGDHDRPFVVDWAKKQNAEGVDRICMD